MDTFRFDLPGVLFIGRFLMEQAEGGLTLESKGDVLKVKPFKLSNSYALGLQVKLRYLTESPIEFSLVSAQLKCLGSLISDILLICS